VAMGKQRIVAEFPSVVQRDGIFRTRPNTICCYQYGNYQLYSFDVH